LKDCFIYKEKKMDDSSVTHPHSVDAVMTLRPYFGGFMHINCTDGKLYWAKLKEVDSFKGIVLDGYCVDDNSPEIVWTKPLSQEEVLTLDVQGIFVFDRGGEFEIFGLCSVASDGTFMHAFTVFDRKGISHPNSAKYLNYFYPPGSKQVPDEVSLSFNDL
jgi:hypothetical protein